MKIELSIPTEVIRAIKKGHSRYYLSDTFKISESLARHYIWIWRNQLNLVDPIIEKVIIVSDFHIPYHRPLVYKAIIDYIELVCPDTVIIDGDMFDQKSISPWRSMPSRLSYPDERDLSVGLFTEFTQVVNQVATKKIFIPGNHEHWLIKDFINKNPEFASEPPLKLEKQYKVLDLGWMYHDASSPFKQEFDPYVLFDSIYVFHGDEMRIGQNGVNLARNFHAKTNVDLIAGHHHTSTAHTIPRLDGSTIRAYTIGCACDLSPSFSRSNKWNHGFIEIHYRESGHIAFYPKRIYEEIYVE